MKRNKTPGLERVNNKSIQYRPKILKQKILNIVKTASTTIQTFIKKKKKNTTDYRKTTVFSVCNTYRKRWTLRTTG